MDREEAKDIRVILAEMIARVEALETKVFNNERSSVETEIAMVLAQGLNLEEYLRNKAKKAMSEERKNGLLNGMTKKRRGKQELRE